MSDCFDHGLDAVESEIQWVCFGEGPEPDYNSKFSKSNYDIDPLYYHIKIKAFIQQETERAFKIRYEDDEIWIPKSICRNIEFGSMYVHEEIFEQCLDNQL